MATDIKQTLARCYLFIEHKVKDKLGFRIGEGTVFNKDCLLRDIENIMNEQGWIEKGSDKCSCTCKKCKN